jgi:membrane protease YdiL (CAAX protease family)
MYLRLMAAIAVEIVYLVFTRTWLRAHFSGIELEMWVTACRLVSLCADWLLFRGFLAQAGIQRASRPTMLLWCGIALLFMVPLLFHGGYPADYTYRVIFALTSVVVAMREEVFYRGVIQGLLERRFGLLVSLLVSNAAFVLYHYGVHPFTASGIIELFAMGCVLGVMYSVTGSLLAPIALHAAYDAMWSLGPIVAHPPPDILRIPFHLLGAALVLTWMRTQLARAREWGAPP